MLSITALRPWIFWIGLIAFVAWDYTASAPVNLRLEPPIFAARSGAPVGGGHWARARS